MHPSRKTSFRFPRLIVCGFLFTALLLLPVACIGPVPVAVPASRVFNSPSAQVSTFTTLTLLSKDDPTHAHWVDSFAGSVDIDGDVLVSGAPRWGRPPGEAPGAAYVYRRTSAGEWRAEATLIASDQDDGFQFDQFFGESIALNGTAVAVGAPGSDDPQAGDNTGAVYVFEHGAGSISAGIDGIDRGVESE